MHSPSAAPFGLDSRRRHAACHAFAAALPTKEEALVSRVLAEMIIDEIVQRNSAEQARREPDRQEVLLTVPTPNASTPRPGAHTANHSTKGLLHGWIVHARLISLVPQCQIPIQMASLRVAEVVDLILEAASGAGHTARAHRSNSYEGARCQGHRPPLQVHVHRRCRNLLIQPVRIPDGPTMRRAMGRLPTDVAHVSSRTEQGPRRRQHARIRRRPRIGEKSHR
mmetsp:Transcript_2817/g.6065  ORF Transcript_2817/g.6065 Transcript_2817/m.6065 type:complete len:224 (+) Transcript_2817:291-962(+)